MIILLVFCNYYILTFSFELYYIVLLLFERLNDKSVDALKIKHQLGVNLLRAKED